MRILLVTPFYPPDIGGIAYHVFNIAKILSKKHKVIVVKNDSVSNVSSGNGIKIVKILSKTPPPLPFQTLSSFRIPILVDGLKEIIKQADVVHVHGHHYPITWLSLFYAKKFDKPTVLTLHGMYALNPQVAEGKTFLEETFNKTIFKLILNRTDSVIGLSKTIVNYAKKYGSKRSKYYVIPNGVDLDLYNGSLHKKMDYRLKYGLPVDNVVILFRGRFNYVKGVMEAAYAARYVTKHWSNVFFIFVGDGPLKNLIKKILNGLKNVKIYDWASTAAIHELYIASDIYLIPSKWEALPITLIEAMAARLYIISTKVGGIPDVLEGYPRKVFIASFDPKAIVEALEKALNKTCATNVTIDLRRCLKQFNWRSIVHTIENVYNETILRLSKVVSKSE